jgi:hypothetical protein
LRLHYTLDNGSEAALLDIVEVEVSEARAEPHQPENWVLESTPWKLISRVSPSGALAMLSPWLSPGHDLLGNTSDRLGYEALKASPASAFLALIEPTNISWDFNVNPWNRIQRRTHFRHGGRIYDLSITDPNWRRRMSRLPHGTYGRQDLQISSSDRVFYTISLTEPFYENDPTGECFKLVAAVIVLPS